MRQIFKVFLIWVPIFYIGMVIFAVCSGRMMINQDLQESQTWFPSFSKGYFEQNKKRINLHINESDAQSVLENALLGLKRNPLSDKPFVQMAEVSVFLKDIPKAKLLYSEALERNMRDRRSLRAMVNLSYIDQNFSKAIEYLDFLLTLKGIQEHSDEYHNALALLAGDKEASKIIDSYLVSRPKWGWKHLFKRIGDMTESNFLDVGDAVQHFSSRNTNYVEDKNLHNLFLKKLRRMGKISEAYTHWMKLTASSGKKGEYIVFNPNFDKRNELPPFNWLEVNEQEYFSEIDQDSGLYASYGAEKSRTLTEQILQLKPGQKYRMDVEGEWSYRNREGLFFWSIVCLESQETVSRINFDESSKVLTVLDQNFQVPIQGCEFQTIKLTGKSGQYSQRIWSRTNSLNISLLQ